MRLKQANERGRNSRESRGELQKQKENPTEIKSVIDSLPSYPGPTEIKSVIDSLLSYPGPNCKNMSHIPKYIT